MPTAHTLSEDISLPKAVTSYLPPRQRRKRITFDDKTGPKGGYGSSGSSAPLNPSVTNFGHDVPTAPEEYSHVHAKNQTKHTADRYGARHDAACSSVCHESASTSSTVFNLLWPSHSLGASSATVVSNASQRPSVSYPAPARSDSRCQSVLVTRSPSTSCLVDAARLKFGADAAADSRAISVAKRPLAPAGYGAILCKRTQTTDDHGTLRNSVLGSNPTSIPAVLNAETNNTRLRESSTAQGYQSGAPNTATIKTQKTVRARPLI